MLRLLNAPAEVLPLALPLMWGIAAWSGLGLPGVWIAYAADGWIRGLLMRRRWARHQWVPHARASRRWLATR